MNINKFLLIACLTCVRFSTASAQTNVFPSTGNVGVGTISPAFSLDVNGSTRSARYMFLGTSGNSNLADAHYCIYQEAGAWVTPFPKLVINYHTGIKLSSYSMYGGIKFYTGYNGTATPTGLAFSVGDGDNNVRVSNSLFVTANVGIGTSSPGSYKLAVEGMIGARKVKVTQAAWADFVFKPDYQLPSLAEVEQYVKTHGHLQDIPNEKEVVSEGLDLGEMNKKLLQKIEELTLYLIDQGKQLKEQEKQMRVLESKNSELEKRMNQIVITKKEGNQ